MSDEDQIQQGQCLCGAVQVTLSGGMGLTMQCHCSECQTVMGGGPAYITMVDRSAVTMSGEVGRYTVKGNSGGDVTRCFCPVCGTPTHSELEKYPDKYVLKVGIFAPQSAAAPAIAIWTGSAPDWHPIPEGIPCFVQRPVPRA
ncbi:GFA family protein [Aestuariicoccus sp. MJ-SS9]|uniref:GFA family protein n=1 Tax=Aestuariicoccus sp. MJ-SS9 TaxID=3079855 RepID=UPI00290B2C27|nr:GFA family protein [Aestuariicoccus sp. MJ-SS9]MDU8910072.1 GFA family protein [Aestuariicoccus sp. MJ-SS9]